MCLSHPTLLFWWTVKQNTVHWVNVSYVCSCNNWNLVLHVQYSHFSSCRKRRNWRRKRKQLKRKRETNAIWCQLKRAQRMAPARSRAPGKVRRQLTKQNQSCVCMISTSLWWLNINAVFRFTSWLTGLEHSNKE